MTYAEVPAEAFKALAEAAQPIADAATLIVGGGAVALVAVTASRDRGAWLRVPVEALPTEEPARVRIPGKALKAYAATVPKGAKVRLEVEGATLSLMATTPPPTITSSASMTGEEAPAPPKEPAHDYTAAAMVRPADFTRHIRAAAEVADVVQLAAAGEAFTFKAEGRAGQRGGTVALGADGEATALYATADLLAVLRAAKAVAGSEAVLLEFTTEGPLRIRLNGRGVSGSLLLAHRLAAESDEKEA